MDDVAVGDLVARRTSGWHYRIVELDGEAHLPGQGVVLEHRETGRRSRVSVSGLRAKFVSVTRP